MPNLPWHQKQDREAHEEQAFIDAYCDYRTTQLRNLFPVTSRTIEGKNGAPNTHESLNACQHPSVKAIRWITKMLETEVSREIPDTDWDEATQKWVPNGKFRTIQTIESTPDGQQREWQCTTCQITIPEDRLQTMYHNIKFDKPEVFLK